MQLEIYDVGNWKDQEVPPEVVTKLRGLQKQYSTVLPNCGDKKCIESMFGYERGNHPGWICQRQKKNHYANKEKIGKTEKDNMTKPCKI